MAVIVAGAIIGLLFGFGIFMLKGFSDCDNFHKYPGIFFFVSTGTIIGCGISELRDYSSEQYAADYDFYQQLDLIALQDNQSINGNFFIATGHISSSPCYTFYYKQRDGYKCMQVLAKNALVYEQERNDGLVKVYKLSEAIAFNRYRYEIFIPKGSILQQFQLDAK